MYSRLFLLLLVVLVAPRETGVLGLVDVDPSSSSSSSSRQPSSDARNSKHASNDQEDKDGVYQRLLKVKRREQVEAVKKIREIADAKKQRSVVLPLLDRMEKVLLGSRLTIETRDFHPGADSFSAADPELREAVALVVENAALFAEFALRLPAITGRFYEKHEGFRELIAWSFLFSSNCGIYDATTETLMNLASQQLGILERSEDFVNPYEERKEDKMEIELEAMKLLQEERKMRKKEEEKKKKEKKKKPTLARVEL